MPRAVLSKGRYPPAVQEHFSKFTDATGAIQWGKDEDDKLNGLAGGCIANDGEKFQYAEPLLCEGAVEDWLNDLMAHQVRMFRNRTKESIDGFAELPRETWLGNFTSQHCLTGNQVWWTSEVYTAYDRLEQGNENAMKEYYQQCLQGLVLYATMVLGEMTKEHRTKVKTLITVDVHGRDIVLKMVNEKCDSPAVFTWQSQLKFRWPEPDSGEDPDIYINICDAQFASSHEFVGNPGRLVITILTDRCYITLTQALRLMMGGAPQGPAGTGKTETTKDLVEHRAATPRHSLHACAHTPPRAFAHPACHSRCSVLFCFFSTWAHALPPPSSPLFFFRRDGASRSGSSSAIAATR